jgi:hypothetical protein
MAVTTLPRPNHRLLGRLVLAILVVAIVVTAFLVGLSQRSGTTVRPPAPAISVPVRISPGPGQTAGELGGGHPAAGLPAADSTCLTVVRHSRTC